MFRCPVNPQITDHDEDVQISRSIVPEKRIPLPSAVTVRVFDRRGLRDPAAGLAGARRYFRAPDLEASFDLSTDVCTLAISPDGTRMAAASRDEPITIWHRNREREWVPSRLPGCRKGGTRCLAFAADGGTLVAGNYDGTVTLWDGGSGVPLATLPTSTEMVSAVGFSPDGRLLAAADSDSRIWLWTTADWRLRDRLEGHAGPVSVLAISPDGRHLASGGEDRTVRLWDLEHPQRSIVLRGHPDVVIALAFSHDGRLLVSSSIRDYEVRLWDVATGESRVGVDLPPQSSLVTCMGFGPDGSTLLLGTNRGKICFRNFLTHKDMAIIEAHVGWVKSLALTSDGKTLVTGGNDGFLRVWDAAKMAAR